MKKIKFSPLWFLIGIFLVSGVAVYAAKVSPTITNQTPQAIAGADSSDNIVPIRVDASGNLSVQSAFGSFKHGTITVSASGATDRTQGSSVTANNCTLKSYSTNAGKVYLGSSTVTNVSGASQGIELGIGQAISNVSLSNLNQIYFAADNTNDKISYFCN